MDFRRGREAVGVRDPSGEGGGCGSAERLANLTAPFFHTARPNFAGSTTFAGWSAWVEIGPPKRAFEMNDGPLPLGTPLW